jgi:hypothetical protein
MPRHLCPVGVILGEEALFEEQELVLWAGGARELCGHLPG